MIRRLCTPALPRHLKWSRLCLFSDSEPNQSLRLNKKGVLDMKQLAFRPSEKLKFIDGKCALYVNKQSWLAKLYLSSHLVSCMVLLGYLIKTNPFYLTFPAAIPLMYLAELILIRRMFLKQKLYKPIVEQINLLPNGQVIEVVYANRISRKLKGLPLAEHFWITIMKPAEYREDDVPIIHEQFPASVESIAAPGPFEYAWIKFYSNYDNHLMIPRRYDYANLEVLAEVFKGKLIEV